jgi:hypothetical protein
MIDLWREKLDGIKKMSVDIYLESENENEIEVLPLLQSCALFHQSLPSLDL